MFKSVQRSLLHSHPPHRPFPYHRTLPHPLFLRPLSTPVPLPQKSSAPPPTPPHFPKPKLDLRPRPIKTPNNSTVSTTHTPTKPTHLPPRSSPASLNPSLNAVKEVTRRDIEDAEAHGVLAPPPPNANWFRRTLHKGVELAKFYYRGIKLIYVRRKDIKLIRARIKQGGSPLSRFEYRLIRTQNDDVAKVIPFLFIALLLEEAIPIIAIYAPFMLPSTCILPSQRERIEEKRTAKATAFSTDYRHIYAKLKLREAPTGHLSLEALKEAEASTAVCGVLRLSTIGFDALRIRRVRNHLEFLAVDDRLIIQDNLLGLLPEKSLRDALQERGMMTQGLSLKAMESRLKWWLDSVGQSPSETRRLQLLVTRL